MKHAIIDSSHSKPMQGGLLATFFALIVLISVGCAQKQNNTRQNEVETNLGTRASFRLSAASINERLNQNVLPKVQERITNMQENPASRTKTQALTHAKKGLFDEALRLALFKSATASANANVRREATLRTQNLMQGQQAAELDLDFTGNEQNYVIRYVCCSQLPIVFNARLPANQIFLANNIVGYPETNELVAVFDDLPIYVGEQIFVRVQRSTAPYHAGWFPLFWLHEIASETTSHKITTGVSYQGISRQIRNVVQAQFYQNCDHMNPVGGNPTFESEGPATSNYKCGEYPVGNTEASFSKNGNTYRFLNNQTYSVKGANFQNDYAQVAYSNATFTFPFYIGNLGTQSRHSEDYSAQEMLEEGYAFLSRTYWKTDEAREDGEVRIHAMDWYFKTWFDASEPEKSKSLKFSLRANLPGFLLYSPFADQSFSAWAYDFYNGSSSISVSAIELGGIRIEHLPLRIDGIIEIDTDNDADSNATANGISDSFEIESNNSVSIRFTDARLTRDPNLSFFDGISYVSSQQGSSALMSLAANYVKAVIEGILGDENGGSFVWDLISDDVLSSILQSLEALHPKLTVLFNSPSAVVIDACKASMPAAYRSKNNNFYAFYRQCLDFGASIHGVYFNNEASNSFHEGYGFTQPSNYWANVNKAGLLWRKPGSDRPSFPCPDDASCSVYIDRPWWADYDPGYVYTGDEKFDPEAWSYASSRGGKVLIDATASTSKHYWHFLRCLVPNADQKFNADIDDFVERISEETSEECRLSALETVCELYGEGEDLEVLFENRWGYRPQLSGYATYCQWAEELRAQDDGELPVGN